MSAFEFKVSGKNATSEFTKDVVKSFPWNERRHRSLVSVSKKREMK